MSYTPTTWHSGDVVTSAKLNNIESGISNAVQFVDVAVDMDAHTMTAAETAEDIWAKVQAGIVVFLLKASGTLIASCVCRTADIVTVSGGYVFGFFFSGGNANLIATSGSDYPTAA